MRVAAGEIQEARGEADVVAEPLEDDAFQMVIKQDPWHPTEGGEGFDVAPEKALEGLVEGEAGVDGAGPGQHEHEAGQDAAGGADLDRAEVPPVHLALLAGEGIEPEEGFGARRGADGADVAADLDGRARVASLAEHGVRILSDRRTPTNSGVHPAVDDGPR